MVDINPPLHHRLQRSTLNWRTLMTIILRRRKLGRTSCREVAARMQEPCTVVRNDKALPDTDLAIRWGTTSNVPCKNVLNTAAAIHEVNDKVNFRLKLDEEDLCPETFTNKEELLEYVDEFVGWSWVVRPKNHSRGRHLYVVTSPAELDAAIAKCGAGWYASPLIDKVSEYRVFVVQGRAVAVARKTPGNPEDVAWNVAKGGRFDNVNWDAWPLKAVRVAIEGFNLSQLDFGGVDIMIDKEGEVYILEINSAPSLTSDYRQTCFAKAFDYIIRNGKERIPLKEEKGGYTKFIHPAVCDRAKVG